MLTTFFTSWIISISFYFKGSKIFDFHFYHEIASFFKFLRKEKKENTKRISYLTKINKNNFEDRMSHGIVALSLESRYWGTTTKRLSKKPSFQKFEQC